MGNNDVEAEHEEEEREAEEVQQVWSLTIPSQAVTRGLRPKLEVIEVKPC